MIIPILFFLLLTIQTSPAPTLQLAPKPMPSDGRSAPPPGGPPPNGPKQTSTASTTTVSNTPLLANGLIPSPTPAPTRMQPPPVPITPALAPAGSGISSVNESNAAAIKAASAIIAVGTLPLPSLSTNPLLLSRFVFILTHDSESTVIIATLLLIFYKLYIRKRENRLLNGVTWAIGHTNQVRTPHNDGGGGAGVAAPAAAVVKGNEGVWVGPGVVQAAAVQGQGQPHASNMQLGEQRPSGSNPPSFHATVPNVVENPFLDPNEKVLPEVKVEHDMHQGYAAPEIHIQPPSITSQEQSDGTRERPRNVHVNGNHHKLPTVTDEVPSPRRAEKELLRMEKELEDLEHEREALERTRGAASSWRSSFGSQAAAPPGLPGQNRISTTQSVGSGGRWKGPEGWVAEQRTRQEGWGRFSGGV
jgi:hypothetical protein